MFGGQALNTRRNEDVVCGELQGKPVASLAWKLTCATMTWESECKFIVELAAPHYIFFLVLQVITAQVVQVKSTTRKSRGE